MNVLGVIGGSGLYDIPGLSELSRTEVSTPFGAPSGPLLSGELDGTRVVFLPRHGTEHSIPPHRINYRANICALKLAGVTQVLSVSAVGSLKEEIAPGHVVVVDQYVDRTKSRAATFFEEGLVAHVSMADPVCPQLSHTVASVAAEVGANVHRGGTYLCMEGPQFSTRAESQLYRTWGMSVIGMTAMPEAKLAREAQLPYSTLAMCTDYDCWHESEENVTVEAVIKVLRDNVALAKRIIARLATRLPDPKKSPASSALQGAILSHGELPQSVHERLDWLLPESAR